MGCGVLGPGQICRPRPVILFKRFFILKKSFFNNILSFMNITSNPMDENLNGHHPINLIFLIRIIERFFIGKLNERDQNGTLHIIWGTNRVFYLCF